MIVVNSLLFSLNRQVIVGEKRKAGTINKGQAPKKKKLKKSKG